MVLQWGGYAPALYWVQNFCRGQNFEKGVFFPCKIAFPGKNPRAPSRRAGLRGLSGARSPWTAGRRSSCSCARPLRRSPCLPFSPSGIRGAAPGTAARRDSPRPPADEGAAADAASGEADGLLLLVNPWTPLPEDFVPGELVPVQNDQAVDARAYPDLQDMLGDMSQAGLSPLICSSYRSQERQQELYDNKVQRVMAEGVSREAAQAEAARWVARPGTSEHQTGLAVDIVSLSNQMLDETQESTPEFQWLAENAWKYGFILRYPKRQERKDRHRVRALALPLRGKGGRGGDARPGPLPGGIPGIPRGLKKGAPSPRPGGGAPFSVVQIGAHVVLVVLALDF